ncbi:MAG TPA: hypothetical protein VKS21_01630 [Spirochaetota bacterium]|nr:hypothetical protein [Spirochaetota bacterium]
MIRFEAAAIPANIIYQGLLSKQGLPFSGSTNFTFELVNSNNTVIWSQSDLAVNVNEGVYRYFMQVPVEMLKPTNTYRLRVYVNGLMVNPDTELASVPYAYYARHIHWSNIQGMPAGFSDDIDNSSQVWANITSDIFFTNGRVGIGTSQPQSDLHVRGTVLIESNTVISNNLNAAGQVTAADFNGNGSQITNLNAANITYGLLNTARFNALSDLGGGIGTTFLRKDGTWHSVVTTEIGDIAGITAGNGLSGGGLSGNISLDVITGTGANDILQLDSSGRIPAVNGSLLTSVNADKVDGRDAADLAVKTYNGQLAGGNTITLVIPHHQPWTLILGCGWPDDGGVCYVTGMENDYNIAVTYIAYTPGSGAVVDGSHSHEGTTAILAAFGTGSYTYYVKCPGETSGDHNILLDAASATVELKYKLIY